MMIRWRRCPLHGPYPVEWHPVCGFQGTRSCPYCDELKRIRHLVLWADEAYRSYEQIAVPTSCEPDLSEDLDARVPGPPYEQDMEARAKRRRRRRIRRASRPV